IKVIGRGELVLLFSDVLPLLNDRFWRVLQEICDRCVGLWRWVGVVTQENERGGLPRVICLEFSDQRIAGFCGIRCKKFALPSYFSSVRACLRFILGSAAELLLHQARLD